MVKRKQNGELEDDIRLALKLPPRGKLVDRGPSRAFKNAIRAMSSSRGSGSGGGRGMSKRTRGAGVTAAAGQAGGALPLQRCAVRWTYADNKSDGQWGAHGKYLERESAAKEIEADQDREYDLEPETLETLKEIENERDPAGPEFDRYGDPDALSHPGRAAALRQSYVAEIASAPTAKTLNGVRGLSGVGVVQWPRRGQVLLPDDAPDNLVERGTERDDGLRRGSDGQPGAGRSVDGSGSRVKRRRGAPGFGSAGDAISISETLEAWQKSGDERLFKMIISPEFGDKMDLRRHVREVVAQMEVDLGTKLEWVAIDHYNTDNPHVHVAIRGVDERGHVLDIAPEYIKEGSRLRAQEAATRQLGYRNEKDIAEALNRQVSQQRFTDLDRALLRSANNLGARGVDGQLIRLATEKDNGVQDFSGPPPKSAAEKEARLAQIRRLADLESRGLAKRVGDMQWTISPEGKQYGVLDFSGPLPKSDRAKEARLAQIRRLVDLESRGLAKRVGDMQWTISPDLGKAKIEERKVVSFEGPVPADEMARTTRLAQIRRLAQLESMGLAKRLLNERGEKTMQWELSGDLEKALREIQKTQDRLKSLHEHRQFITDPNAQLSATELTRGQRLTGRLVGTGLNEANGRPYVMIEGVDGKVHYLSQPSSIVKGRGQGAFKVGSYVTLTAESFVQDGQERNFLRAVDHGPAMPGHALDANLLHRGKPLDPLSTVKTVAGQYRAEERARLDYMIQIGALGVDEAGRVVIEDGLKLDRQHFKEAGIKCEDFADPDRAFLGEITAKGHESIVVAPTFGRKLLVTREQLEQMESDPKYLKEGGYLFVGKNFQGEQRAWIIKPDRLAESVNDLKPNRLDALADQLPGQIPAQHPIAKLIAEREAVWKTRGLDPAADDFGKLASMWAKNVELAGDPAAVGLMVNQPTLNRLDWLASQDNAALKQPLAAAIEQRADYWRSQGLDPAAEDFRLQAALLGKNRELAKDPAALGDLVKGEKLNKMDWLLQHPNQAINAPIVRALENRMILWESRGVNPNSPEFGRDAAVWAKALELSRDPETLAAMLRDRGMNKLDFMLTQGKVPAPLAQAVAQRREFWLKQGIDPADEKFRLKAAIFRKEMALQDIQALAGIQPPAYDMHDSGEMKFRTPPKPVVGVLVEHGEAYYEFREPSPEEKKRGIDPKKNYYVRIKGDDGKETVRWGVDLPRAIKAAGVELGEKIALVNTGKEKVTVTEEKLEKGVKVTKEKQVELNRFEITKPKGLDVTLNELALQRGVPVRDKEPEPGNQYTGIILATEKRGDHTAVVLDHGGEFVVMKVQDASGITVGRKMQAVAVEAPGQAQATQKQVMTWRFADMERQQSIEKGKGKGKGF